MLTELCQEIHNWFERAIYTGTITVGSGSITFSDGTDPGLLKGQYFRVVGSVFSDGVHQYPDYTIPEETFEGAIWAMAIPAPVIKLAQEIQAWRDKYESADSAAMSPFTSESFAGYSYAKSGAGRASSTTGATGWRGIFRTQLNRWRKL